MTRRVLRIRAERSAEERMPLPVRDRVSGGVRGRGKSDRLPSDRDAPFPAARLGDIYVLREAARTRGRDRPAPPREGERQGSFDNLLKKFIRKLERMT